jgi:hypothetical protein
MPRGVENRLRKLEAKLRPPEAFVFIAWHGPDENSLELASRIRAQLTFPPGSHLFVARWPNASPVPPRRWSDFDDMTWEERDTAAALVKHALAFQEKRAGS